MWDWRRYSTQYNQSKRLGLAPRHLHQCPANTKFSATEEPGFVWASRQAYVQALLSVTHKMAALRVVRSKPARRLTRPINIRFSSFKNYKVCNGAAVQTTRVPITTTPMSLRYNCSKNCLGLWRSTRRLQTSWKRSEKGTTRMQGLDSPGDS